MQNFTVSEHEKLNTAIALGFFDGLHKGHRRVILSAVEQKKNGLLPVCFTFAQSPKEVLGKSSKGALMTTEDKLKTLESLGIEHTFSPDFKKLMNMSAKDFVEKIIFGDLNAKFVVCGFNYRFGKNGEGDTDLLKKLCDENGTKLKVIEPERDDGDVVSYTYPLACERGKHPPCKQAFVFAFWLFCRDHSRKKTRQRTRHSDNQSETSRKSCRAEIRRLCVCRYA